MPHSIAIKALAATTLGLAIAFAPAAFAADDMKKDTMTKDNMSKDKMDKDNMKKDSMKNDTQSASQSTRQRRRELHGPCGPHG
jgi:pentapeptide MXKDX repeat protein